MELIDPVHIGSPIVGLPAQIFRPVSGEIENNVQHLNEYYQRRGGQSHIDLYPRGITDNGNSIPPYITPVPVATGNTPFIRLLEGTTLPTSISANTHNITSDAAFANHTPANVEYINLPLGGDTYDGTMYGKDVEHDSIPWYVRGNVENDIG